MQRYGTRVVSVLLAIVVIGDCQSLTAKEVTYQSGTIRLKGYLETPAGSGPFPAVIYLHGGLPPKVGGDPAATAKAIARAGFVGFSPIRRNSVSLPGNIQDVIAAISYVNGLKNVDKDRLAVIGFSRGGLLAFMASTRRRDIKAVVLMAPAAGNGALVRFLPLARNVAASTLILVARNDKGQADHVSLSQQVNTALKNARKETRLIIYPPYGRDGHLLFFQVRQPYWQDVEKFLKSHLSKDKS
jgi:dienelactone hydrolase